MPAWPASRLIGSRTRAVAVALATGLAGALITLAPVRGAEVQDMVGRWYAEISEEKTLDGQRYTIRRQVEENRPDGTKTVTFRFYDSCRLLGEMVNHFTWGVNGNVYWARCTSIVSGGQTTPCNDRTEYDILRISPHEMSYRTRPDGTLYNHTRVADSFRLPDSSCLGRLPRASTRNASLR
jgi:hypothetical protein